MAATRRVLAWDYLVEVNGMGTDISAVRRIWARGGAHLLALTSRVTLARTHVHMAGAY